jgi:hypothetical protein
MTPPRRKTANAAFAVTLGVALAISCKPDFALRESLVTRTEILAVRSDPPEVRPDESATHTILVATPDGPLSVPAASWAFCATPKLLTENGAVSAECLKGGVRPIADGPATVTAPMPNDACFLFGPEVSSAELRPRDPDVTGGFYQPVRVTVFGREGSTVAFGSHRIRCKLASAGVDIAADFDRRYTNNKNPELLPLEARASGAKAPLDAIPPGARVTLRAAWPESSAEAYVALDVTSQTLAERREWMRVSWFATAGSFENDRTGRTEEERETFTDNDWTAPEEPRTTHLFVVLRDARGGVTWSTHALVTR